VSGTTPADNSTGRNFDWLFDGRLKHRHYRVIVADPPWRFLTFSPKGRDRCPDAPMTRNESRQNKPERHYATMALEDIMALPAGSLAADDCVLFLWAVDAMLPQALAVGQAWGFTFKTVAFYWAKLRREGSTRHLLHDEPAHKLFPMGTGYWTRSNPEQCLLFTRGRPRRLSAGVRKLIISPRREHSRKPDETLARVEALASGPYCELFARRARPGWDCWGNELETADACAD
jgi:N6-adenosine-specific RNA methylase IME4